MEKSRNVTGLSKRKTSVSSAVSEHGRNLRNSHANLVSQLNINAGNFKATKFSFTCTNMRKKGEGKKCCGWSAHGEISKETDMNGYLPIRDVALLYGVTTRTVRNWISEGYIVAYKRNNHAVLIDERSLDSILKPIRGAQRG